MTVSEEQTYFLNQLYRDFLLPTILGSDNRDILYWAGKKLARQYQLDNVKDLPDFFTIASFGTLKLISTKPKKLQFELSGTVVTDRIAAKSTEFSLEAGLIAETVALENGHTAESQFTIDEKSHTVTIDVVIDLKD